MKYLFVIFIGLFLGVQSIAQDKSIDKLEILYDQGYYKKVLRKSKKLLADPLFDYSGLPSYYKSLSIFRLVEDPKWHRRHSDAIDEAVAAYRVFLDNANAKHYVTAHFPEIMELKIYLEGLRDSFEEQGKKSDAKKISDFLNNELKGIKGKPVTEVVDNQSDNNTDPVQVSDEIREKIVVYAKSFVGVKYVWAGSTPDGFDCSGFTSYVHKKYGFAIARTASGQMDESKKIKLTQAQKGDLVFFGSGQKITHVGIVVSGKGDKIFMVHASSSKGVIVTNVEDSSYWNPKLKAAGTYLSI